MLDDDTAVEPPAPSPESALAPARAPVPTSAGTVRTWPRARVDLMGVPLGFAAVAQCWSAARRSLPELPMWSVNLWWLSSAALAVAIAVGCLRDLRRNTSLGVEAHDPTLGPFLALTPILLMVYGPELSAHAETAGRAVFLLGLVALAVLGTWFNGWWIIGDVRLHRWHPGYLLPTAIGGLVAAASGALLGYRTLALLAYGWGLISWIVIGSIVLGRLCLAGALPTALTPTLAILAAPPAAAADAWLLMNGDPHGLIVGGLAGYVVLTVGVQLCLTPTFRRVPFGAGWWALVVSYSAVAAFTLDWLARSSLSAPAQSSAAVAVLAAVSVGITVLAVRSVAAALPVLAAAVAGQGQGPAAALSSKGRTPLTRAGGSGPGKEP